MDTGVDNKHPDLSSNWRGGTNSWFDPYNQHGTPYDTSGHGTQTMGVIVGGSNGGQPSVLRQEQSGSRLKFLMIQGLHLLAVFIWAFSGCLTLMVTLNR